MLNKKPLFFSTLMLIAIYASVSQAGWSDGSINPKEMSGDGQGIQVKERPTQGADKSMHRLHQKPPRAICSPGPSCAEGYLVTSSEDDNSTYECALPPDSTNDVTCGVGFTLDTIFPTFDSPDGKAQFYYHCSSLCQAHCLDVYEHPAEVSAPGPSGRTPSSRKENYDICIRLCPMEELTCAENFSAKRDGLDYYCELSDFVPNAQNNLACNQCGSHAVSKRSDGVVTCELP